MNNHVHVAGNWVDSQSVTATCLLITTLNSDAENQRGE